jgi:hypothetical protein
MRSKLRVAAALLGMDAWRSTTAFGRGCRGTAGDRAAMADPDPGGEATAFTAIARKLPIPETKATIPAKKPVPKRA